MRANTGARPAQPGHMKSLYSSRVTEASAGPWTQSSLLTGGKSESCVGPGVGRGLITVHPAGIALAAGVGEMTGVELGAGDAGRFA
jgi:hypothetical protein